MLARKLWLLASLAVLQACGSSSEPTVLSTSGLSSVLRVDRIYKSMEGPMVGRTLRLQPGPQELLWITAYRTKVVGEAGEPISQEFMCHNNLQLVDWNVHAELFGWEKPVRPGRLFTTSQGFFEIELPEGYGIPVLSNEPMRLQTQVLNHNIENPDLGVRHHVTIEYMKDEHARGRLKPLYPVVTQVMALVDGEDGVYAVAHPSPMQEDAACSPGQNVPVAGEMATLVSDRRGQVFTLHWILPPGPEERRTLVTSFLNLSFDTTVHYIATHLHPFATSLELRDLTTGETVFEAKARGPEEGIGLDHVDPFSSTEGVPLFKDHDYEMVSIYDNTSGEDQDAMASFFLFLHDREAEAGLEAIRQALAAGEPVGSFRKKRVSEKSPEAAAPG